MIPAGFLSVIPAAASSSRNRAAGSADKVTFSAIPIRSWTGREVERAGASDDVMGLLRFGWEKESLLVQSVCGGGGLAHIETWNPVGLASTAAARPGSDRTHSTTIRRYPGILGTLFRSCSRPRRAFRSSKTDVQGVLAPTCGDRPPVSLVGAGRWPSRRYHPRILGKAPSDVANHSESTGVGNVSDHAARRPLR